MKGLYGFACLFVFFATFSFGQTVTSAKSGFWDDPSTWVGNVVPTDANSSLVSIIATHTITVRDSETANGITIANSATSALLITTDGLLQVSGNITLGTSGNRGRTEVSGTGILEFEDGSTVTNASSLNLIVQSGGTYRLNYSTAGVIYNADFKSGSIIEFTGYSDQAAVAPTLQVSPKTFHHIVWNCTSQGNDINLGGILSTVNGDFTVNSTSPSQWFLMLSDSNPLTLNVAGNLNVNNDSYVYLSGYSGGANVSVNVAGSVNVNTSVGSLVLTGGSGSGTLVSGGLSLSSAGSTLNMAESAGQGTLTVNGDITVTDGQIIKSNSGTGILNVNGNFSLTSGSISNSGGGTFNMNFDGAKTHTYSYTGTPISSQINYIVTTNDVLDLGTSVLTGSGNFTNNGTVRLGSTDAGGALQNGSSGGNVQVSGSRTFSPGTLIVYNGTGPQFIGNGFPSGGDVNLTINNTATPPNNTVTLSANLDIVALRVLTLTSGNIVIGTQTLTINGSVSGTGGVVGGPLSNLVIGGTGSFGTLTFSGTNQLQNFTLNRTSSGLVTLGDDLTILGTFTHTAGTLEVGDNVFTISGDYGPTNPDGLSVTSASTVLINGSGTLPDDVAFQGSDLGTLTLNRALTTLTTSASLNINNLNLFSGTFANGPGIAMSTGGTITRTGGSISTSPNNTTNAYNVVYTSGAVTTGPELPSNSTALANLSKTGSGVLTLNSNITVNGVLTLSSGTFNAGSKAINLKGNFVSGSGATLTGATVTFSGATVISGAAPPTFGVVTISGTLTPNVDYGINGNLTNIGTLNAGTGSVTFGGTTAISGAGPTSFNNLTITGSLTPSLGGTINVAGNFNNNGTFTQNGGTVVFNGTSTISGTVPTFNNVTVTGTLTSPPNLILQGNLNLNNGTFIHNDGTVTFSGSQAQSLNRTAGSGTITYDFYNLAINKSAGTFFVESSIAGTTFRVENQLTIADGTSGTDADLDGASGAGILVLRSTSLRTAQIPAIAAGTGITGNLTVERFIPNTDGIRAYRYFAPPVQGSTVADWQQEIPITGWFADPSTGAGITDKNSPSMYRWVESNGGESDDRYERFPYDINAMAASVPLENGRGYAVYVRSTGTPTLNTRGTLRTGNVPITLTLTGSEPDAAGYNLIGNPYPAPIDWDLVSLPAGVSSTIALKDNVDNAGAGTGNYVYYVKGGPSVGNFAGVIPSSQAFWVTTTVNNAILTLSESNKVSDTNPMLVREASVADLLRINLQGNGKTDESVIWLEPDATDDVDLRFDAKKKVNDYLNLYTILDSAPEIRYAINGVKDFGCSKSFRLGLSDINVDSLNRVPAGTYTLSFSEIESFRSDYNFTLTDKFKNQVVDVKLNPEYNFEITADTASFGEDRFMLSISQPDVRTDNVVHYQDICENAGANVTIENAVSNASYEIRDEAGRSVSPAVQGNGNALVVSIPPENLTSGTNNLLVYVQNGFCAAVPLQQTITLKVNALYDIKSVQNGTACRSGVVTLSAQGAPADGDYSWYDTEMSTDAIGTGAEWTTPLLSKSKTYFVAAKNALGCEGPRAEVKADIVQFEDASITDGGDGILASNYSEGVQWYFNDEAIPDATNQQILATESGTYTVKAQVSGCETSASYDYLVTGIEQDAEKSIRVFPNPFTDRITIELNDNTIPAEAKVVNSVGNTVGTVNFHLNEGKQTGEVYLGKESPGLYLIRVIQGRRTINYKVIKK